MEFVVLSVSVHESDVVVVVVVRLVQATMAATATPTKRVLVNRCLVFIILPT